ncbi:MAG: T9SS type A sorting domain-containing protein [Flavobacteriales bacterium]|nr:T9SS type A sorting domain-containing protein [Flavobacteriales bacterium]
MKRSLLLITLLSIVSFTFGQISQGGMPLSFELDQIKRAPIKVVLEKPDLTNFMEDDIERESFKYPPRDAVIIPVNKSMENDGEWEILANGDRIWRLEIYVPDAVSLELFYEDFFMPPGAKLFLYDPEHKNVFGAFTEINNKPRYRFATDAVPGENTVLEYFEPAEVAGQGRLTIKDLGYAYRDLRGLGGSQHCEVDVNCSEGEGWANEIDATVRIRTRISGNLFWCTGTLMNNTSQDCKPYILSALHCALNGVQSSTADYDLYKFYWKFQTPGCDSGNASAASAITGCDLRGDSNDGGGSSGSDFMLLELQENIPASYNPFWAGWSKSSVASSGGGVCIHHPNADVKKISTFSNTPQTASWNPGSSNNNHWRVFWEETDNGWGVTEGGSSGSGLFDAEHKLIGTLTGGASFCEGVNPPNGPDDPDMFGKMNRHFVSNPNPSSEKLSEWLDPIDNGATTFEGSANPCGNVGIDEISADKVFTIFPNPSNGNFVLEIVNEDLKVDLVNIFDAQGKIVRKIQSSAYPISVDLSNNEAGIYLVQLILEGNKNYTRKIVLEK